jgi:hypothetical protein
LGGGASATSALAGRTALKVWRVHSNWLPGLSETANFALPMPLHATPEPAIKIRKRDRDRTERIRLARARSRRLESARVALALEMEVVRTKDLTDIGIPRCYLARMRNEGLLVKVGYGHYRAAVRKKQLDARYEHLLGAQDADAVVTGWAPDQEHETLMFALLWAEIAVARSGMQHGAKAHCAAPLGLSGVQCVKFSNRGSWVGWLCGLAEVGFLVLPEMAHVEVAVGLEPVFVGLDS